MSDSVHVTFEPMGEGHVEHMLPGTLGIPCERLSRYTDFTMALKTLREPEGTLPLFAMSSSVPENHEYMLRNFQGGWLWNLDDDMVFERDMLGALLSREVEVICPLSTTRSPPIHPMAYTRRDDGIYEPVDLRPDHDGLMEIDACGWGGLLVRRSAIDKLGDPPYIPPETFVDHPDMRRGSDLLFCERLKEAGVSIYLDTTQRMGHIGQVTYSPSLRDGVWGVVLDLDGGEIFMPWGEPVGD